MPATIDKPTAGTSTLEVSAKYLTFKLGPESYGIKVVKVREIIRLTNITAVPQMPHYIKGVINLRGRIIPVVDLRLKLGVEASQDTEHTCIIVVQVAGAAGAKPMGLMVDAVEEVVNISAGDLEETPDFGAGVSAEGLLGMAKIKGVVKTLLDIDRILGCEALAPAGADLFKAMDRLL
jgi:purine-binding chemotaxis protein CheW